MGSRARVLESMEGLLDEWIICDILYAVVGYGRTHSEYEPC